MIKTTIEVKEETIKKHKEDKIERYCDLCSEKIDDYQIFHTSSGRDIRNFELNIEECIPVIGIITSEYNYGDCGGVKGECYDICEKCYKEKLKPLLKKELNIKPRKVEYDW